MNKIKKHFDGFEENIKEQINNLNQKLNEQFDTISKRINGEIEKIEKKIIQIDSKYEQNLKNLNDRIEKQLNEQISKLNQELLSQIEKKDNEIKNINENIGNLQNFMEKNQIEIQEQLKVQEEISNDKINKFQGGYIKDKSNLDTQLEVLKNNVDVININIDVIEKRILENVKSIIYSEIKNMSYEKEQEILMNIWIDDLNDIINNLEKLKNLHPKDLKLKLNEISYVIDSYRQKFTKQLIKKIKRMLELNKK